MSKSILANFFILGSQAFKQLDEAKAHFHDIKFRVQDIILSRTDNQNILSDTDLFTKAIELHQKIMGSGYNDSNICLFDASGACLVVSVLQVNTKIPKYITIKSYCLYWAFPEKDLKPL